MCVLSLINYYLLLLASIDLPLSTPAPSCSHDNKSNKSSSFTPFSLHTWSPTSLAKCTRLFDYHLVNYYLIKMKIICNIKSPYMLRTACGPNLLLNLKYSPSSSSAWNSHSPPTTIYRNSMWSKLPHVYYPYTIDACMYVCVRPYLNEILQLPIRECHSIPLLPLSIGSRCIRIPGYPHSPIAHNLNHNSPIHCLYCLSVCLPLYNIS